VQDAANLAGLLGPSDERGRKLHHRVPAVSSATDEPAAAHPGAPARRPSPREAAPLVSRSMIMAADPRARANATRARLSRCSTPRSVSLRATGGSRERPAHEPVMAPRPAPLPVTRLVADVHGLAACGWIVAVVRRRGGPAAGTRAAMSACGRVSRRPRDASVTSIFREAAHVRRDPCTGEVLRVWCGLREAAVGPARRRLGRADSRTARRLSELRRRRRAARASAFQDDAKGPSRLEITVGSADTVRVSSSPTSFSTCRSSPRFCTNRDSGGWSSCVGRSSSARST
jgi:hypothetical protein